MCKDQLTYEKGDKNEIIFKFLIFIYNSIMKNDTNLSGFENVLFL